MGKVYLGVDVGSVSTNLAVLDESDRIISTLYIKNNGQPIESVKKGLKDLASKYGDLQVQGAGTTGSGRQLIGLMVGADAIKNEITAHARAVRKLYPEAHTIFEIGGQDSKIILMKNGQVTDFAMNTVCAAGTGSFLEHQAERLGIPIQDFGTLSAQACRKVRIAGRCTVFAESDMISKQQYGFSKAEIVKGLCEALVRNYLNNLCRGKRLEPPYIFQGGVAANEGIKRAFEAELGESVVIPEHYGVMGAIGAALIAREEIQKSGQKTRFRSFELTEEPFNPETFDCTGCDNGCEIVRVEVADKSVGVWGDRCGKWSGAIF